MTGDISLVSSFAKDIEQHNKSTEHRFVTRLGFQPKMGSFTALVL